MKMKRYLQAGVIACAGIISAPFMASAQDNSWLLDLQNDACSDESKQTIADLVRKQIEDAVARAEAAIQPPAAIGDLSCLNDLMTAPLDTFSNVGGLLGSLQGGLTGSITGAGGNVSRQVCDFAAEKWAEVTEPLNMRLSALSGVGSDLWDGFDLTRNGSSSSNGSTGSSTWSGFGNGNNTGTGSNTGTGTGNGSNTGTGTGTGNGTGIVNTSNCDIVSIMNGTCNPTGTGTGTGTGSGFTTGGGPTVGSGQTGTGSNTTIWNNMTGGNP